MQRLKKERMSKIQELVDKLRTGYQTESIVADLGKRGLKHQNLQYETWE